MAVINCPNCGRGQVRTGQPSFARCPTCGYTLEGWVVDALKEIVGLPEARGTHACECCYPQMRRLPDGTYWCPACGEEILTLEVTAALWEFRSATEAFRRGWLDGYLETTGDFASSTRLARLEAACDRLDYYRGHRMGSRERRLQRYDLSDSPPDEVPILRAP